MTREEAIRLLDLNREYLKNTNNIGLKDDIEALDMAIQALVIIDKIEPMFGDMLDIPTQELMRDATPEERESIDKYIKSISKPTGIEFDEEQEQLDFVQPHKQNPVTLTIEGDAISREAVLDMLEDINAETEGVGFYYEHYVDYIKALPSVKPQEPKTGHWIAQDIYNCHTNFKCSECGYIHSFMHLYGKPTADYTYCPCCGAKMSEIPTGSESEVNNG